jgi:hypothetical protein
VLTEDELMQLGADAEQALPYIENLMDRVKGIILDHIIALGPDDTMRFTVYKSQIMCLDDILATVSADIRDGQKAIEKVQGNAPATNTGIL